ncbi:NRDE family protein [Leucobacter coleopterorum]|uniref:NRDE family protein n=1 Tax=Leucobacter coleopterorum TaxID=2714933 RepID=A0ABX6JWQ0_9MICO|nr:NRDE family protein [Leucobacter coleopterorum]QIM18729.1 NRDE family protein [Leucobacter coleopterorum]
MCTVVVEVRPGESTRVLAVRDEDPERPWDGPGEWWPTSRPEVIGVRDRRANGAWLALAQDPGRLGVILNRAPATGAFAGAAPTESRGGLVLDAVSGRVVPDQPRTGPFNLVEVSAEATHVTSWDGLTLRRETLSPGVHMIAHHLVDDTHTARIERWLPEFTAAAELSSDGDWQSRWLAVLERSAQLGPEDDRAIIRDNTVHGYPTLSLLVCLAEVRENGVGLTSANLTEPGRWNTPVFSPA